MKSVKLSDYYKIIKPKYCYIKITTHKSVRNYNTTNIAKVVANTYKSLDRYIRREEKKLIIETSFKISYVVDIFKEEVNFYFIVPEYYLNQLLSKIKEIWGKATIDLVENIPCLSPKCSLYSLSYSKDDVLSLDIDKKSNEPLNQILVVMDNMVDDDRVTLIYNFTPINVDWESRVERTMERIRSDKSIDRINLSSNKYILKLICGIIASTLNVALNIIDEFLGVKHKAHGSTVQKAERQLSQQTNKKKSATIIKTQIAVVSTSNERSRQEKNAISVCNAFNSVDGDNTLVYRKEKLGNRSLGFENTSYNIPSNLCSVDEIKNFIQIPGRELVEEHRIEYIKTQETVVPTELREGKKCLGTTTYKGNHQKAYIEDDYNMGNLPLVPIGAQGAGKTTLMANYCHDSIQNGEGVVVIDFIKNCELSKAIEEVVPRDKIVVVDLGDEKSIQGIGYNEIIIESNLTTFQKLKLANMQSQQIMNFIDSISIGDPLSSRMRRPLNAAATLVFVQGYNSIKNVVECLENYKKRADYIKSLPKEFYEQLEDEISTLEELDEKDKSGAVVGTKSSKIEHILDRIGMIREDFLLKYMYNKNLAENINLVDCMQQGKVVLIKMREDDFPTKMAKNILVTYWISKVWLASQLRGRLSEKPLRCNVVVDEVFQAPTTMKTLEYILPQSRKFGSKFVFSTQYLRQLDSIADVLEASGSSYMLLKGALEDDFNHLKNKIKGYDYEDLRDMEQYSSLNLIYYSKGYSSFITKLPPPIKS